MSGAYEWSGATAEKDAVQDYSNSLDADLDLQVALSEGRSQIRMDGDYDTPEDVSEELVLGVALGEYTFDNLDEYSLLTTSVPETIETPLWQNMLQGTNYEPLIDSEYAEHGFINAQTISEEIGTSSLRSPEEITNAQKQVYDAIEPVLSEDPISTTQIMEKIEAGEINPEPKSAQHRPWVNDCLNDLAENGFLGKFSEGRETKYVSDSEDGFRRQVLHTDLDAEAYFNIIEETKRPVKPEEIEKIKDNAGTPPNIIEEYAKRITWESLNL